MESQAEGIQMLNQSSRPMSDTADNQEVRHGSITCISPATNQVIAEVAVMSSEAMMRAVQQARDAQRSWRRYEIADRVRCLRQASEKLMDHRKELLDLLSEETGKTRPDAMMELLNVFDTIAYYLENAELGLSGHKVSVHLLRNKRVRMSYTSMGVVLNISSWSLPLELAICPAIPALLAGNAVIIKPSEYTPLIAMTAARIINESGLPRGLLQVVPGYGESGELLCHQVDGIVFSGKTHTGRIVSGIAGERLIPSVLTLSGKDAMIVLNDADLERSSHGAVWGAFFHAGQTGLSVERAYVQEDVYDAFVARVVTLTKQLRQGDPIDSEIDVGAMTKPEHIEVLDAQLADAVRRGATVLVGGKQREDLDGYFYEPTILVGVTDDMRIMREETFGPILPIMRVRSPAEAIQRANGLQFGLGASVWSKNAEIAQDVARQLDCGGVCINDVMMHSMAIEAPFGGNKSSGCGRRKGLEELRTFTTPKTVLEDVFQLKREPFWYPYNTMIEKALDKTMVMLYRKGITRKITDLLGRG